MNPSSRKPSLPRLTTNLTSSGRSRSTASLPVLVSRPLQDANVEKPAFQPTLFPENNEDDENVPPTVHYAPVDSRTLYVTQKSVEDEPVSKLKTLYYEDAFTTRGSHNSPKERFGQDSVVVAELKTNWKAEDDSPKDGATKLVEDLALRLAQIYQRPESSMMVAIQQDVHLLFGSASVPAYLLKIYALPHLIAPITNLRNTALIQNALQELLGAAPDQGVIIYLPTQEDNLATNGVTVRGEITRLERLSQDENPGLFRTISRSMSRRLKSGSGHSQPTLIISAVQSPVSPAVPEVLPDPISAAEEIKLIVSPKDPGSPRGRKRDSFRDKVFNRLRFHDYLASQVEKDAELEGKK
ncbi:hypothetical protein N7474_004671 [Penicillium riverlandense]|uniref:uncharacterized protein n=1 Tax=Penicillium riverlandense TaxID=1903569 RepID=UPI0025489EA1|nr:uncharacterized protein N7474_004671 [Penicillium riverlandense]KAJ5819080.1 hypothetical protein N7474_004671 [Penicillium riverlandense]